MATRKTGVKKVAKVAKAPKLRKMGQQKGTGAKSRMRMGQKMSGIFKDKDKDKM